MTTLTNKRVLLGVTGGIAAYKSADLIRRLQDAGADVRVAMTENAKEFITPLTLQALSGKPVHTDLLDTNAEAAMGHIELARWADIILIAPASADFLAKLNNGEGGNLLLTLCLAARCSVAVAPAMNQAMWSATATQDNIVALGKKAIHIFGPAAGTQACGDVGLGRMLEPLEICRRVQELFQQGSMAGKKVLITAGPTREPIDPVRYLSNHSSGKMGYALAEAMVEAGASVTLISGPVHIVAPERVKVINVETALQMESAVGEAMTDMDVFIGAAAVADYRPVAPSLQKLKKINDEVHSIELVENPDIIAGVAAANKDKPSPIYVVGFAAETNDVVEYAKSKRARKQLDMIIANDVSDQSIGFASDDNAVWVITSSDTLERIEKLNKNELARQLTHIISDKVGA